MRTTPILAIDTASPSPAVTLLTQEGSFDEALPSDRHASERLLAAIEGCLERARVRLDECGRIAVCSGPGSFTGVRVGLATAWGLGRSLGCPVEAVSTLAVLAEAARAPGLESVAAALDAGRGELVWQPFDLTGARARPFAEAGRAAVDGALQVFANREFVCLPADLLGAAGASRATLQPLSRVLAAAVSRAPTSEPASNFAAIYSRPSAAEEKRGAP